MYKPLRKVRGPHAGEGGQGPGQGGEEDKGSEQTSVGAGPPKASSLQSAVRTGLRASPRRGSGLPQTDFQSSGKFQDGLRSLGWLGAFDSEAGGFQGHLETSEAGFRHGAGCALAKGRGAWRDA